MRALSLRTLGTNYRIGGPTDLTHCCPVSNIFGCKSPHCQPCAHQGPLVVGVLFRAHAMGEWTVFRPHMLGA